MARSYETALAELENKKGELEALSTIGEEVEYLTPLDWSNDPVAEIFGGYEAMNNYLY